MLTSKRLVAAAVALSVVAAACSSPDSDSKAVVPTTATPTTEDSTTATTFDVSGPDGATEVNAEVQESTWTATVIGDGIVAYSEPSVESDEVANFGSPNKYGDVDGNALTFQTINYESRPEGWIQVLLPIRPNGSTGWVQESEVSTLENPYRIEIDTKAFELVLFERGIATLTAPVAIGNGDTPTPTGSFYIHDLLQPLEPNGPYGSFALGLSGFSETLEEFNGGNGVVGIHGTNDPSAIGSNASHGCVRVTNDVIEQLATISLGAPVYIT